MLICPSSLDAVVLIAGEQEDITARSIILKWRILFMVIMRRLNS